MPQGSLRNGWTLMDWTTGTRSSLPGYNHSCPEEKQMLMTPRLMTGSATDVDEQDPSALEWLFLVVDCVQLDFFLPHRPHSHWKKLWKVLEKASYFLYPISIMIRL